MRLSDTQNQIEELDRVVFFRREGWLVPGWEMIIPGREVSGADGDPGLGRCSSQDDESVRERVYVALARRVKRILDGGEKKGAVVGIRR